MAPVILEGAMFVGGMVSPEGRDAAFHYSRILVVTLELGSSLQEWNE